MKKIIRWLGKLMVSGFLAITVLNIFSLFYYNFGIRKTNTTGATDYVWENTFYSLATEGFALGFNDENGLNNSFEPKKNDVDILLMGSSHMEARNVPQNKSTAYLLNQKLYQYEANKYVYNIGVEGHDFYRQASNLENAIKIYEPKSYVIMQMSMITLDENKMREVLDGTLEKSNAYDEGIIYYLQKVPFLRVIHHQLVGLREKNSAEETQLAKEINSADETQAAEEMQSIEYESLLEELLSTLATACADNDCGLIIFYIPSVSINNNEMQALYDKEAVQQFENVCLKNNIVFVNMAEDFNDAYSENRIIPYGFSNTSIGSGHLNRNGHALVADRLFETIMKLESEWSGIQ